MNFGHRAFYILTSSLAALLLANCGGNKTKSQLTTLTVNPSKPIVISADATVDGDKRITGPWFQFGMSMTNSTTEKITIVALELEVFGQGANGNTESRTVVFTPGQLDFTVGENLECKFTNFGTWNAGETKALAVSNGNPACARQARFFVGGNTRSPGRANFNYRVRAQPLGWFGTEDAATDRFDRSVNFFTQ